MKIRVIAGILARVPLTVSKYKAIDPHSKRWRDSFDSRQSARYNALARCPHGFPIPDEGYTTLTNFDNEPGISLDDTQPPQPKTIDEPEIKPDDTQPRL